MSAARDDHMHSVALAAARACEQTADALNQDLLRVYKVSAATAVLLICTRKVEEEEGAKDGAKGVGVVRKTKGESDRGRQRQTDRFLGCLFCCR